MNAKTTAAMLGLVVLVLGLGLAILFSSDKKDDAKECATTGQVHKIDIRDSKPSDEDVQAKLCDKLMFTNRDETTRKIGFGQHDKHVAYDGISEKVIGKNDSFTIALNKTGKYYWHDHFREEIDGYFTVTE